jgi:preprotein translocase subunit SecE
MNKIIGFLQEVKIELSKVVWPKKDELIGSSIIVCLIAIIFAIILGFMDFSFSRLIKILIS